MNARELQAELKKHTDQRNPDWCIYGNRHCQDNELTLADMSYIISKVNAHQPTTLGLANIGLTDEQVVSLAQALESNTSITCLYLPFNNIGDKGAAAIAALLMKNTSITSLILFENKIFDRGCMALANALIANDTLGKLEIFNNPFSNAVLPIFEQAMATNHELEKLVLSAPLFGEKLPDRLQKLLDNNKSHHRQNEKQLQKLSLFTGVHRQIKFAKHLASREADTSYLSGTSPN